MELHGNARTCLHSRRLLVDRVLEQDTLAELRLHADSQFDPAVVEGLMAVLERGCGALAPPPT